MLASQYRLRHYMEQLLKTSAARMVRRQQFQHAHQPGHDPAVAAAPEDLLAVGFAPVEVGAITVVEMFDRIVKIGGRAPPILHCKVEIALVPGSGIDLHPHWRSPAKANAPRPPMAN